MEINSSNSSIPNSNLGSTVKREKPLEAEVERLKETQNQIQEDYQKQLDDQAARRSEEVEQSKSSDANIGKNLDFSG